MSFPESNSCSIGNLSSSIGSVSYADISHEGSSVNNINNNNNNITLLYAQPSSDQPKFKPIFSKNLIELHTQIDKARVDAAYVQHASSSHANRASIATVIFAVALHVIGIIGLILLGLGSPYAVYAAYLCGGMLAGAVLSFGITYSYHSKVLDCRALANRITNCKNALSIDPQFILYFRLNVNQIHEIDVSQDEHKHINYHTVLDMYDQYLELNKVNNSVSHDHHDDNAAAIHGDHSPKNASSSASRSPRSVTSSVHDGDEVVVDHHEGKGVAGW